MCNQGTKTDLHVLQVTSMINDILVHLNSMNKMEDFSNDERCLHLSFRVSFVKLVTITQSILSLHVASSRHVLAQIQSLHHTGFLCHSV